jgi:hypothetical protein
LRFRDINAFFGETAKVAELLLLMFDGVQVQLGAPPEMRLGGRLRGTSIERSLGSEPPTY